MNIATNSITFGAHFAETRVLKNLYENYGNNKTIEFAKKLVNLPQKDKLKVVRLDYFHDKCERLSVKIENLTSGMVKVFDVADDCKKNLFNKVLSEIIDDAEQNSEFWSKLNMLEVINILTGKTKV